MRPSVRVAIVFWATALPVLAGASHVYVSNEDGNSVTVIDTATDTVVATVPVGKRPRGLQVSRDGAQLFVALSGLPKCPPQIPDEECEKLGRDVKADGIAVVDTKAHRLISVYPSGSDPEQFDLTPDGKRMFIANEDKALATVLDVSSGKIVGSVPVGREPEGVRASPNGKWVLVTNESDNSVSIIDTQTLKVLNSVRVGLRPRDAAFTANSETAYVSGEFDASVYRLGVPAGKPLDKLIQLRKEARPMTVLLDEPQKRLFISTGRGGTVAVVSLPDSKLVTEIKVGARPWGMVLSKDRKRLYTANGPSNDVSVVDTKTLAVIKTIPVGKSPWGVALGQ